MNLESIKGLGKKRIETLNNKGITSAEDLALYFPKTYYNLNSQDTFEEDGKYKLLNVKVISEIKISRIRKDFSYSYCECLDLNNNKFKAIWYNQTYLKNAIKEGDKLFLYGKNSNNKHNYFVVSNFRNQNKISKHNLLPIYKSIKNLGQNIISSCVDEALKTVKFESIIPKNYDDTKLKFTYEKAINIIHNPTSEEELNEAKTRIDIEKILPVIKTNFDLKNKKNTLKRQKYTNIDTIFNKFCSFLPYTLTNEQQNILKEIFSDLRKTTPMNRLIQGDVGSRKTIIALITALVSLNSGYSSIFIAPTEILAKQHYELALSYFSKLGFETHLLTSHTSNENKKNIYQSVLYKPTLIIGTQSCLNEHLDISNVGVVIIDEQHRFGVKQRASLVNRNPNIDLLTLSATPIPRSLSIVYYGGMDISTLDKPPKEKKIQTNIIKQDKENDMWNFIENKIQNNSKVYVVCANIDDADDDDYQNLSVNSMYKFLCNRFSKDIVLMAHGKQDSETENKTLLKFKNENYKILVSTTIVEVGIDIKNADIIVIISPEKFGLATLHQLRGRVGRVGQQSYCFCLSKNLNEKSYERIKFFKDHLNGFDIADFDYQSRGAGNILGTSQHGKIENVFEYISLNTYKTAKEIFEKLSTEYNTDELFKENKQFNLLNSISLN